jgi:hypothetical protein
MTYPFPQPGAFPLIAIQYWSGDSHAPDRHLSRVWDLPYVIPYIEAFISFSDGSWQSPAGAAAVVAGIRDQFLAAHPRLDFQWAWWPHRYGIDGLTNNRDRLVRGYADRISGDTTAWVSGLWTHTTVEAHRTFMQSWIDQFIIELRALGVPLWKYVNPDYEAGAELNNGVDLSNGSGIVTLAHTQLAADPRAATELFDGTMTYNTWIASLRDLDGVAVPTNELFWHVYDSTYWKRACLFASLSTRVTDWALDRSFYSLCRERNPKGLCGNWNLAGSSRQHPAGTARLRECAVDMEHFKGDFMMPANYGGGYFDVLADHPDGYGYDTFTQWALQLGINVSNITDKNQLAEDMLVARYDYFLKSARESNPTAQIAFSTHWAGDGIWFGKSVYSDDRYVPAGFVGATIDFNKVQTAQRLFNVFMANKLSFLEIFAQDATKAGLDLMHDTLEQVFSASSAELLAKDIITRKKQNLRRAAVIALHGEVFDERNANPGGRR